MSSNTRWAVSQSANHGLTPVLDSDTVANYHAEDGYLLQKEWPIYTFDALLMANVLGISQMWYVGKMRPQLDNVDLETAEGGLEFSHQSRTPQPTS